MAINPQYTLTAVDPEDVVLPNNKVGEAILSSVITTGLANKSFGVLMLKKELRTFIDQSFQNEELRDAAKFAVRRPKVLKRWLSIFLEQQILEQVSNV